MSLIGGTPIFYWYWSSTQSNSSSSWSSGWGSGTDNGYKESKSNVRAFCPLSNNQNT